MRKRDSIGFEELDKRELLKCTVGVLILVAVAVATYFYCQDNPAACLDRII